MAFIFDTDISEDNLLLAYVNNVVKFYTDTTSSPVLNAEITFNGSVKKLYPGPDGKFEFNFMEFITALINVDNFKDDLNVDIVANGYAYDWTQKVYIEGACLFKINFADLTFESETRSLKWLSALMQLEDFKRKFPIIFEADKLFALSPFSKAANEKAYVKYFEGYPFDISFYIPGVTEDEFPISVENKSNLLTYDFSHAFRITRVAFCDGNSTTTIEDVLSLEAGLNDLLFSSGAKNYEVFVDKVEACSGVYLKWINELGGWNYFLFFEAGRTRQAKDLGDLENDFYNLPDTISPMEQMGRTSNDILPVVTDILSADEVLLLEGIFDSPKIYMFTGQPNAKNSFNDWLEVSIKTTTLKVKQPKKVINKFEFQIELPPRNTRTL